MDILKVKRDLDNARNAEEVVKTSMPYLEAMAAKRGVSLAVLMKQLIIKNFPIQSYSPNDSVFAKFKDTMAERGLTASRAGDFDKLPTDVIAYALCFLPPKDRKRAERSCMALFEISRKTALAQRSRLPARPSNWARPAVCPCMSQRAPQQPTVLWS